MVDVLDPENITGIQKTAIFLLTMGEKYTLKAFERISRTNRSFTINLGAEKTYSVLEVVEAAAKITGKKINYHIAPRRPGDIAVLCAKTDLAQELLDWRPRHSDLTTLIESAWNVYKNLPIQSSIA